MSKVTADISMSLDGFVTEPDPGGRQPVGRCSRRLHDWMVPEKTAAHAEIVDEIYATLAPEKFRYVSKLAEISPDTKVFCNMDPTMLYYDVSSSRAHISLGKDAAYYCPDIPNVAWNEDVQPFGFQGIKELMTRIDRALGEVTA